MHAVYANCFGAPKGDVLLTEEPGLGGVLVDRLVDPDEAQELNHAIWRLAFTWTGPEDPTVVHGISAAELGGAEAAMTGLIPAARGILGMRAALRDFDMSRLTVAIADGGTGHNLRIERNQARAAALAAGVTSEEITVRDERNAAVRGKYERTRDVDQLAAVGGVGAAERIVRRVINTAAGLRPRRRQGSLLVLEYNPTRAFARSYVTRRGRMRLVRLRPARADVVPMLVRGDAMVAPPPAPMTTTPFSFRRELSVAGIDVWPAVGDTLLRIAGRYAAYLEAAVPVLRTQLERWCVKAVLVPFDTPPEARVLVRVAQSAGIPTFVLSDGFKADDFSVEGSAPDVAFSWSESMAEHYFSRWPQRRIVVTGNPKAEEQLSRTVAPRSQPDRILVGSFTFSPVDLNCRRSDPERFVEEVLAGIRIGAPNADVTLKLHPADEPGHYASRGVKIVTQGDVVDMFGAADVYITTYSTSLIEAIALGLPAIYYRVNPQRLHPPFDGDDFMAVRTASGPEELASLLADPPPLDVEEARNWATRYLGPSEGAVDRIAGAIASELASRSARA